MKEADLRLAFKLGANALMAAALEKRIPRDPISFLEWVEKEYREFLLDLIGLMKAAGKHSPQEIAELERAANTAETPKQHVAKALHEFVQVQGDLLGAQNDVDKFMKDLIGKRPEKPA